MKPSKVISLVIGMTVLAGAPATGRTAPRRSTLKSLVRVALKGNPTLKQIQARIRAVRARAVQRKALPDPKVTVGLLNMPFWPASFNATPMSGLQITATQEIPWPTKLTRAGRVETKRAEVHKQILAEARLKLAVQVRLVALNFAVLHEERRLVREHGRLLDRLIRVAEVRYRVSKGMLQDLLKARLARATIADQLQRLARSQERAEARLNALLGRQAHHRVALPSLPRARPIRSLTRLVALATSHRPLLAAWRHRIQTSRLQRSLARTGYLPDFGLSLSYRYRRDTGSDPVNGMDFWSVGVSIRLPLWSLGRTRGRIKEAEARIEQSAQGLRAARLRVARDIRTARDAIRRLDRRLAIYKKRILPLARQALQAATSAYTTSKVDFLTVLDHQRSLLKHETQRWRLRARRAQQWEVLRAAVGRTP